MLNVFQKTGNGWSGETKIDLDLPKMYSGEPWARVLTVRTCKDTRGRLWSRASVNAENGSRIMFEFDGFLKTIERSDDRCTEKAIKAMHARAVANLPGLIEEAKAFYLKQAA